MSFQYSHLVFYSGLTRRAFLTLRLVFTGTVLYDNVLRLCVAFLVCMSADPFPSVQYLLFLPHGTHAEPIYAIYFFALTDIVKYEKHFYFKLR